MKARVLAVIATCALTTLARADRGYEIAVVATDLGGMGIVALAAGVSDKIDRSQAVAIGMVIGIGGFALGAPIAHGLAITAAWA